MHGREGYTPDVVARLTDWQLAYLYYRKPEESRPPARSHQERYWAHLRERGYSEAEITRLWEIDNGSQP